jgi:hypothetical protein
MAHDPARQPVVLFGGSDSGNIILSDTWVWGGDDWAKMNLRRPGGREL